MTNRDRNILMNPMIGGILNFAGPDVVIILLIVFLLSAPDNSRTDQLPPGRCATENSSCKCAVFARYVHGDFLWDEIVDLAQRGFIFVGSGMRFLSHQRSESFSLRHDAAGFRRPETPRHRRRNS